jgi:hypothetical protein
MGATSWMMYTAAALLAVLGLAHSWLGEVNVLQRLFRRSEDLPRLLGSTDFTKNTLRFVWHLITVMAIGFALLILQIAANASAAAMANAIGAFLLLSGLLPLVLTRGRHLSWVVLFVIAALCMVWAAGQ